MTDKFEKDIQVGDYVMFTSYGADWRVGIVAKVSPKSAKIYEGWRDFNGSRRHYTYDKRSNTQLIVLSGHQISYAIDNCYPFKATNWTLDEYMKEYETYRDSL